MVCSLAAAALVAAVPAFAQQPYGAGARARPVSTFATPYPTTPTPPPVRPYTEREAAPIAQPPVAQQPADGNLTQAGYRSAGVSRPGGAAAPGAAGKVMYFYKPAGALLPDGMADAGAVAMASNTEAPTVGLGVPDVPATFPGALPPTAAPATVIEKPIGQPTFELVLPAQPFNAGPIPSFPVDAPAAVPQPVIRQTPAPVDSPKELDPRVTELPPRGVIFLMYDDAALQRAILKSIGERLNKPPESLMPFPKLKPTVPPGTPYVAKTVHLPPSKMEFEAGFVIHHRLLFEEKNSERYGWDLGFISPFVSTAAFYRDVLMWPHNLATSLVVGGMDTNAGKCLPGSPTPYYLYPPGLTITGGIAEGVVITGLSFVIP